MEYYLAQSGILGQKWGRRRYQNEDGSLTAEGRIRYGVGARRGLFRKRKKVEDASHISEKTKISYDPEKKTSNADITRIMKNMSDEEMLTAITRLENEKRFRELAEEAQEASKSKTQKYLEKLGKQLLSDFSTNYTRQLASTLGTQTAIITSDETKREAKLKNQREDEKLANAKAVRDLKQEWKIEKMKEEHAAQKAKQKENQKTEVKEKVKDVVSNVAKTVAKDVAKTVVKDVSNKTKTKSKPVTSEKTNTYVNKVSETKISEIKEPTYDISQYMNYSLYEDHMYD